MASEISIKRVPDSGYGQEGPYTALVGLMSDERSALISFVPPFHAPKGFFECAILFVDDGMKYEAHIETPDRTIVEVANHEMIGSSEDRTQRFIDVAASIIEELNKFHSV